jgi:hypothetical protein
VGSSLGTREKLGSTRCPFCWKKFKNLARISLLFIFVLLLFIKTIIPAIVPDVNRKEKYRKKTVAESRIPFQEKNIINSALREKLEELFAQVFKGEVLS